MKNQKHFSLLSGFLAVSGLINPLLAQTSSPPPLTVEKNFGSQTNNQMPDFIENLTLAVKQGKIVRVEGYENEVTQIIETIRQAKRNPIILHNQINVQNSVPENVVVRLAEANPSGGAREKQVWKINFETLIGTGPDLTEIENKLQSVLRQVEKSNGNLFYRLKV